MQSEQKQNKFRFDQLVLDGEDNNSVTDFPAGHGVDIDSQVSASAKKPIKKP